MAQFAMAAAPVLLPMVERMSGKLWDLTERGIGYLADKVFGPSKNQQTYMPDYSRYQQQQQQQLGQFAYNQSMNALNSQRPYYDSGYGQYSNNMKSGYFNEGIMAGNQNNPYRETLGATNSSGFSEIFGALKPIAYQWISQQISNYLNPQSSAPYLNTSSMYANAGPSFGSQLSGNTYTGYGNNFQEQGYDYVRPTYSQRYNDRAIQGNQSMINNQQFSSYVDRPSIETPQRQTYLPPQPVSQSQNRNIGLPVDPYSMGFDEPIYRGQVANYGTSFETPQKRRFIGEPVNQMRQFGTYDTGFDF